MNTESLTGEHLEYLGKLYEQFFFDVALSIPILYVTDYLVQKVILEINKYGYYEVRVGSKWTPHSKLELRKDSEGLLEVKFHPNFHPDERDSERHAQAVSQGESFSRAFLEYLAGFEG